MGTPRVAPDRYVRMRRARRAPFALLCAVALVGLLALAAGALLLAGQDADVPASAGAGTGSTEGPSTPRDEWARGSVPYLYQTDPQWADHPDAGEVRAALAAGKVVICSVRPGDFTTVGHFIVLAGLTDDGRVEVRDPNSTERSAQAWGLDRVLGQCANLWALSA